MGYGPPPPGYGPPAPYYPPAYGPPAPPPAYYPQQPAGPVRSTGASVVSIVLIIDAIYNITCATCVFSLSAWLGSFDWFDIGEFGTILYALSAVYLLVAILQILVAFGVWTLKPWSWLVATIILILSLVMHGLSILVGNVFGIILIIFEIIALVFLFLPETRANFEPPPPAQVQGAPPPSQPPPAPPPPTYGTPPPPY